MSLHEAEIAMNAAILVFVKTVGAWAVEAFALWYFGRKAWRRLDRRFGLRAAGVKGFAIARAALMSRLPAAPPADAAVRPDTAPVPASQGTTWQDVVRLAASVKRADGSYHWSANDMAGWGKVNRNEVLAIVREVRGGEVAVTRAHDPEKPYPGSAGHAYVAPPQS